jgi:hypothetical protein
MSISEEGAIQNQKREQHLRKHNVSEFKIHTRILLTAYIKTRKNIFSVLSRQGNFCILNKKKCLVLRILI